MKDYIDFLKAKEKLIIESGFECNASWHWLKPFQQFSTRRALKKGRYAIFADCGLGKTRMQLTWADEIVKHEGKAVIGVAPLAVVGQTIAEGIKIGIEVIEWVQGMELTHELAPAIYMTNYEQLDNIPADLFCGVFLDESSILKNFEGATRNQIIEMFANTPYKLACTATPSPNDPMELGNHAEFLNVMSRNEMLAMYFVHDGGDTAKWRLKGHSVRPFWKFVNKFSIMFGTPSDIGFSDDGYILPDLNIIERRIETPKQDNGRLFNDKAISATNFNAEIRITMDARLAEVATIVNGSTESFIIWIRQDAEGDILRKLIPGAIEVSGSDKPTYKREKLLGFQNNEFRVLITKYKIAGFGMNYQNCHNMVFASPDFSFEAIYQAIRRMWRFGQQSAVNAYMIVTDTMESVKKTFHTKAKQFEDMQESMKEFVHQEFESDGDNIAADFEEYKTDRVWLMRGDSVQTIKRIPDESVGFSIFSPPFAELYTYSDNIADMGNSRNYKEFFFAFQFLVKDIFRILWSGRNVAVHCMDLPIQKGKEGYIGLRDFSGMILKCFEDAGFIYHSRVTIWKNPVTEMQRTKALGLLHKQIKKDASMSRVGIPDYLLVFRKPGEHLHPINHNDIPVDLWQQYASPVWMDIDYGDTLNARSGRDEKDEKHICPLQLPTIRRATHLWSNEGDTVYTPFLGVGSEPYVAIELNRKAIGGELKHSYFKEAVKNCSDAEDGKLQTSLFAA